MSSARSIPFAVALPLALASCTIVPPLASGELHEVRDQPLPPFETHEDCVAMLPRDQLEYSFEAQMPITFYIQYREGKVQVIPLTRERVQKDQGRFEALTAQNYCLTWESGLQDTMLDYRARLIRSKPDPTR